VPPLPHQERQPEDGKLSSTLLVDGGYTNQYPIEVLKDHGAGVVITIVACADYGPVCTDYGDVVRGGVTSLRRMFGCKRHGEAPDPPSLADIQDRLMFLVESMKESNTSRSDLTIYPPIQGYDLLDFGKYKEIEAVGYNTALPRLREWINGDSKGAQQIRQVMESTRVSLLNENVAAGNKVEAEYGGREKYGLWRRMSTGPIEAGIRAARFLGKARSHSVSSPDLLSKVQNTSDGNGLSDD